MTATDKEAENAALAEMLQETNLTIDDLEGHRLYPVGGYPFDEDPRPAENFYNSEWRDVYVGYVKPDRLERVKFPDGEVAGVMLVPLKEAKQLLQQQILPMASALTESLPVCLSKGYAMGRIFKAAVLKEKEAYLKMEKRAY